MSLHCYIIKSPVKYHEIIRLFPHYKKHKITIGYESKPWHHGCWIHPHMDWLQSHGGTPSHHFPWDFPEKWGVPKMLLPPNHPNFDMVFHEINPPAIKGIPPFFWARPASVAATWQKGSGQSQQRRPQARVCSSARSRRSANNFTKGGHLDHGHRGNV